MNPRWLSVIGGVALAIVITLLTATIITINDQAQDRATEARRVTRKLARLQRDEREAVAAHNVHARRQLRRILACVRNIDRCNPPKRKHRPKSHPDQAAASQPAAPTPTHPRPKRDPAPKRNDPPPPNEPRPKPKPKPKEETCVPVLNICVSSPGRS